MFQQLVLKEGYLEKESSSRLMKKWQSRYFELSGHYLKYYEKKEAIKSDETVKGAVDVHGIRQVTREGKRFSLKMADESKSVMLRSSSDEVAELWVTEIEQLRHRLMTRMEEKAVTQAQPAQMRAMAFVGLVGIGKLTAMMTRCKQMSLEADTARDVVSVSMACMDRELFCGGFFINAKRLPELRHGIFTKAFRDGHWLLLEGLHEAPPRLLHEIEAALSNKSMRLDDGSEFEWHPQFRICATAANATASASASTSFASVGMENCLQLTERIRVGSDGAARGVLIQCVRVALQRESSRADETKRVEEMIEAMVSVHEIIVAHCSEAQLNLHDLHRWAVVFGAWGHTLIEGKNDGDPYLALSASAWLAYHAKVGSVSGSSRNSSSSSSSSKERTGGGAGAGGTLVAVWKERVLPLLQTTSVPGTAPSSSAALVEEVWASEGEHWIKLFPETVQQMEQLHGSRGLPLHLHPRFESALLQLWHALKSGLPVLLVGVVGSGKTTAVRALARTYGEQVAAINATKDLELKHLVSQPAFDEEGQLGSKDGVLMKACREGEWALIENIHDARPRLVNALCGLLQQAEQAYSSSPSSTRQGCLRQCLSALTSGVNASVQTGGAGKGEGMRVICTVAGDTESIPPKLLDHFIVVSIVTEDEQQQQVATTEEEQADAMTGVALSALRMSVSNGKGGGDQLHREKAVAVMSRALRRVVDSGQTHLQSLIMRGTMRLFDSVQKDKALAASYSFVDCLYSAYSMAVAAVVVTEQQPEKEEKQEEDDDEQQQQQQQQQQLQSIEAELTKVCNGRQPRRLRLMTEEMAAYLRDHNCFAEVEGQNQATASQKTSPTEAILFAHMTGVPLLLEGPPAIGKTMEVRKVAEVLLGAGRKLSAVSNTDSSTVQDYFGGYEMDGSSSFRFVEGPLVHAMVTGGWFLADEFNLASADVHSALQLVIELLPVDTDAPVTVKNPITGNDITISPDFRFFATQNPSATMLGRKRLSRAFACRLLKIRLAKRSQKQIRMLCRFHLQRSFDSPAERDVEHVSAMLARLYEELKERHSIDITLRGVVKIVLRAAAYQRDEKAPEAGLKQRVVAAAVSLLQPMLLADSDSKDAVRLVLAIVGLPEKPTITITPNF
eukprot:g100.t1